MSNDIGAEAPGVTAERGDRVPKTGPSGRPSMVDVGRLANVSAQTVSRYFTGTGYVGIETRERIRAAIEELGYVPHQAARNLRAARTHTIGVLAIGALNYGSSGVITGITRAARSQDVTVMIAELDIPDNEQTGWEAEAHRALNHFVSMRVDGVILSSPIPGVERVLQDWDPSTPVAIVSSRDQLDPTGHRTPSYLAAISATRHLISLGHRRVLHVCGPSARNETREREAGYRAAMREAGLAPQLLAGAVDWSPASGFWAGESCDVSAFTAVFAANDEIALGFVSAMASRGLQAPRDFSIVGVDDMPAAGYFSPPLTTMRLDFRALGRETFAQLRQQIITGVLPDSVLAEPELVVRASTAPPGEPEGGTRAATTKAGP